MAGLGKDFLRIEAMANDLRHRHGKTHFVFVAPYNIRSKEWKMICNAVISNGIDRFDASVVGKQNLDIYFIDRKHFRSNFRGEIVVFSRLSIEGHP